MKDWWRRITAGGVESTLLDALPFSWVIGIALFGKDLIRNADGWPRIGGAVVCLFIGFVAWAVLTAIVNVSKGEKKNLLGRLGFEIIALAVITWLLLWKM